MGKRDMGNATKRCSGSQASEEQSDAAIVAVSANPFDMGVEHWLRNLDDFRKLSRIGELQTATQKNGREKSMRKARTVSVSAWY